MAHKKSTGSEEGGRPAGGRGRKTGDGYWCELTGGAPSFPQIVAVVASHRPVGQMGSRQADTRTLLAMVWQAWELEVRYWSREARGMSATFSPLPSLSMLSVTGTRGPSAVLHLVQPCRVQGRGGVASAVGERSRPGAVASGRGVIDADENSGEQTRRQQGTCEGRIRLEEALDDKHDMFSLIMAKKGDSETG
jgi:hypothetical protein